MLSQTTACFIKSSTEIFALLKYYAVVSGNSLPTDNLLALISRVKKFKRENRV